MLPLHAANPSPMTGSGNWTYFFAGRHPLLVDAGVGEAAHLDAIHALRNSGPGHVVVTHAHGDHIGGVAAIQARWEGTRFSKYPSPDRDFKYPVAWQGLRDGDVIPAGDEELHAVHTPGHAPDHIALWHEPSRTLLSGDLVVRGTTVVILASAGGSLRQYLQSLERVLALAPRRLLPAHGPAIDDPETLIRQYIAHRRERERQIREGLAADARTVGALVDRIYVGLAPALVPMARESVLAHLIKLEDEGLARREDDEWYAPAS